MADINTLEGFPPLDPFLVSLHGPEVDAKVTAENGHRPLYNKGDN